jgi:uncharacterized coiled-coil protein SlyX
VTLEERLDELEIRYSYLDDAVQTLNETIISKDLEIDRLKKRVQQLENSIETLGEAIPNEKPPHY